MIQKNHPSFPVLIVGAGLSGLTCALRLHQAGIPVHIIEASDGVGGRVRTDQVDGFLLDRGFQVYLSAYPQAGELLDLEALELQAFEPGAIVYDGKGLKRVMDVFRRPRYLIGSALSSIGSLADKMRVALLRFQTLGSSEEEIRDHKDQSTESFLREFGFSEKMINGFFRCFYGGIFLETELRTSSRMFEFTFKMFSQGSATLPARGMGSIPLQLARRLPAETIRINSPATSVTCSSVTLANGSVLQGSHVVLATQASQTSEFIPSFSSHAPQWRSVTNVYYAADKSPLKEAIIALNGSSKGLVNNVCVPSDVSPLYAPEGKSLISVSLLGLHRDEHIPTEVKKELAAWFGEQVDGWQHLRTDIIKHALPEQAPKENPQNDTEADTGNHTEAPKGFLKIDDIMICGDHTTSASIEGAIISGNQTAAALLASMGA
ncbi:FAD-dependent oxidoreductase [Akkermansiaceae bacterium]|nr:FAD-dependent oxidoreductase [Akkermansiaceae bacterium]